MVSPVIRLLRWPLLAVSLVVGLAALLRMAGPIGADHGELSGVIRLPRPVTQAIVVLFALAALVFFVGIARRLRASRRSGSGELELVAETRRMPAWMRALTQILSLANFALVAYLIWRGVIPLTELLALGQGAISGLAPSGDQSAVGAPAFVTWTFGVLAVVAGLGSLVLALWLGFGDRLVDWWTRTDEDAAAAARPAERPLEDPRAELDPRRAIMRCYAWFERVAAASGVPRPPWLTPMEFMRQALARLPGPHGAVPTLTGLFELARFSRRALGASDRERALEALDEVTATTAERRGDAAVR